MKPTAAPTTGTRLQILNLLQEKGEASVGQLAEDLALASATVRRHLDVLLRDRLVEYHQVRKSLGRPEYAYTLTEDGQEVLPKHYQDLLSDVLLEMSKLTPEDTMGRDGRALASLVFSRLAEKITQPYQEQDLEPRLAALLDILAKGDFSPDVERLNGGVRILLHNCPYRSVAQSQESVCFFDESLISNLLKAPVEKEQCIRIGHKSCCYIASLGK
ncbi:MAG: ArsR family transcriptional regulator [SAR202 cluster bacterium]|nr:ArsR family transcriptional regulator [SAR202 cluster bacterium]